MIRIKNTFVQMFDLVIQLAEGCSITTTSDPGHGSPCATIQRFDDPYFVFFEPMKCHISSNSISWMLPGTVGSGNWSAASRIQRQVSERDTPNRRPNIPYEDLHTEYIITANAFLATKSAWTLPSPITKLYRQSLHSQRALPRTVPFLTQLPLLHFLQLISVISIALCKVKTLANIVNISIYVSTLSHLRISRKAPLDRGGKCSHSESIGTC